MASLFDTPVQLFPLRPRQQAVIDGVRQAIREGHKRIVVQAPTGSGKCHGKGTEVIMYDGSLRKVEDIRPGDLLMGPDSLPRTVGNTSHGYGPLYRVTPIKGEPFVCNDVHVLSLKRTNTKLTNYRTGSTMKRSRSDCKDGEIVNIPLDEYLSSSKTFKHIHKLWHTGVMFPPRDNCFVISPYVMGLWLGDGNSRKAQITTEDEEIAREFVACGERLGLRSRIEHNTDNSINVHLSNGMTGGIVKNPFQEELRRYDLVLNKHIPTDYILSTREQRLELLAGIVDTDGYAYGNCVDIIQKSERLASGIVFLARSLGLRATMAAAVKICTNNGVSGRYFRVNISGETSTIPCRLRRKRCLVRTQKKDCLLSGFTVEAIGEGEYFGFTLDGDHLYLLRDFTVTHNTIVASHIIAGSLDKGKRPLFTVPQISLIEQTIRRFEAQGICDIGVIQAQHARTDGNARVQIASIQTLVRRELPDVDVVLIDEIHLSFVELNKIFDSEAWANKIVIGLSATPWAKGMGHRWTKLVPFGTTQELIAESWLTPLVAYGVPDDYMPDMTQVRTVAGEYVEDDAEQAMTTAPIVGNVVATWKAKHGGAFTFMFCVNRSHARKMQKEFEEAGVPCGYIDGTMDADQRERVFEKYRSGEYKIIASVGCLIVGVDERVECIIFLVLTKSEMKWVQAGGRGLRLADGKDHLLLLDHSGTCEALGLFTDIHHETLDMHDPKQKGQPFQDKKPPKPHKCKACNAIVPKGREVCPICGEKMPKPPTPRHVEGELVEVKGGKAKAPKREYTMAEKQEFYSGLLYIAQQRGKAEGVAAHRYRDKFGVWPNQLRKEPRPPSFEVVQYDKYCRIRYAKSKQRTTEREVVNA